MGNIDDGDISILKNKYSFFILPTMNENFGHVIVELLSIGLIPMISKGTTPFDRIIEGKIKFNFSLNKSDELTNKIFQSKNLSNSQMKELKTKVKNIYSNLDEMQVNVKKDYINFINQNGNKNKNATKEVNYKGRFAPHWVPLLALFSPHFRYD